MNLGMELEAPHSLDTEIQFWDDLDRILSTPCDSHETIDNTLRAYLELTTGHQDDHLYFWSQLSRCSSRLLGSDLFLENTEYIRRQIIHSLIQEDDGSALLVIVSFLLVDGREDETTFEMMNNEGAFGRLLDLIRSLRSSTGCSEARLARPLFELFYEMSRIQRIKIEDLVLVDDDFIKLLFTLVEEIADDSDDPYHYPIIRALLVLNEQFMVSAHDPIPEQSSFVPPTNKVIKVLSLYGSAYKMFGQNIILLLNREDETSLQLLTLKLLYLLFTTPQTYEYFYTNDLRVLVDILIRNLFDLPEEASALRHTYLRVLHPLLAHTQLKNPPYYKREQLRGLFEILIREQIAGDQEKYEKILHFDEVDETTRRLVLRCTQVEWLIDHEAKPSKPSSSDAIIGEHDRSDVSSAGETKRSSLTKNLLNRSSSETLSLLDKIQIQASDSDLQSPHPSISMTELATQTEKPGVMMPRKADTALKKKPEPPKARGTRGRRQARGDEGKKGTDPPPNPTHGEQRPPIRRTTSESEPPTSHTIIVKEPSPTPSRNTMHNACVVSVLKSRVCRPSLHPPAVPPPRRSSQSVPPHLSDPPHHSPLPPTPPNHQHHNSHPGVHPTNRSNCSSPPHPPKPEPPPARRWRAHLHAHSATDVHSGCNTPRSVGEDALGSTGSSRDSSISNLSRPRQIEHPTSNGSSNLENKVSALQLGEA